MNPDGALRKIAKSGKLAILAQCTSSRKRCVKSTLNKQVNDAFLRNKRIEVVVTSQDPDIKIMYVGASDLAKRRQDLKILYFGGFDDSEDPDCQLFYSIKQNVIQNMTIVISLDSPEIKQRFCVASQIFQGLGLSLPVGLPFSKLWKNGRDRKNPFNEETVLGLIDGYRILEYIHMCPDIKPGMKAPALRRLLERSSRCLDGVKAIPEQKLRIRKIEKAEFRPSPE